MEFKYIQKSEDLFKGKLYLKDREVSIIEFQYRIFDLVKAKDTPLMERLQFIHQKGYSQQNKKHIF